MGHEAVFTPEQGHNKWYLVSWQSQDTKITVQDGDDIRLRLCIVETGGAAGSNTDPQLQYRTDKSSWFDFGAPTDTDKIFRWRNDAGLTEHASIDSDRLTCTTESGITHGTPLSLNSEVSEYAELEGFAPVVKGFSESFSLVDAFAILYKELGVSEAISLVDGFALPWLHAAWFETNDFSEFDQDEASSGETRTVQSTEKHHGTYAAKFTSDGSGTYEYSRVVWDSISYDDFYARAYFKIASHGADSNGEFVKLIRGRASGEPDVVTVGIFNLSGTVYWWLEIRDGAGWVELRSDAFDAGTNWFCLEVHWVKHATAGGAQVWVNGESVYSDFTRDTDNFGNIIELEFGIPSCNHLGTTNEIYMDCVMVDDEYIGEDVTEIPKGYSETIGVSDAWAKVVSMYFKNVAETIGLADAYAIVYKALGYSEAISVADAFAIVYKELGFSDTISVSDAFTLLRFLNYAESIGLTDVWSITLKALGFSDSFSLSDAFVMNYRELGYSETIGVADAFVIVFKALGFSDTIGLSDVWALDFIQKFFADTINASDAFASDYKEMGFATAVSLADAYDDIISMKGFSDTISVADVFAIMLKAFGYTDTIGLTDAFVMNWRALGYSETVSVADVFSIVFKELGFSDSISVVDAFAIMFKALGFSDTISAVDTWVKSLGVEQKAFSETISVSDSFGDILGLLGFADTISVADGFLVFQEKAFADAINAADTYAKTVGWLINMPALILSTNGDVFINLGVSTILITQDGQVIETKDLLLQGV
jgi:hypothetical protein